MCSISNPADEFLFSEVQDYLAPFYQIYKDSKFEEIFALLELPQKRFKKGDGEKMVTETLFQINRALALELLTAAWLSQIDSASACPNALENSGGKPYGYAPKGKPDVQMDLGEVRVIAEVSSGYDLSGSDYLESLESALGHLRKQTPPCYCLHIMNWDSDKHIEDKAKFDALIAGLGPDQHLIRLSIAQTVNVLNEFREKPRALGMSAENMGRLLKNLHQADKQRQSLEKATNHFIGEIIKTIDETPDSGPESEPPILGPS